MAKNTFHTFMSAMFLLSSLRSHCSFCAVGSSNSLASVENKMACVWRLEKERCFDECS